MAMLPTSEELLRWAIYGGIVCALLFFSAALREKSLRYRGLYVLALFGGIILTNMATKWLIAVGYEREYHNSVLVLIWLGPVLLFSYFGRREWRYGSALLRERHSPLPGWPERDDNTDRGEEEAVAYGKSRREMAVAVYAIAAVWFIGGIVSYVA